MIYTILLLFIAAVFAFWLSGISGGGASMLLLPLLSMAMPLQFVPFALTVGTFSSAVSRIIMFRKHIYKPFFMWFVPFSIPAVGLGVLMLKYFDAVYIQLLIAVMLFANIAALFRKKQREPLAYTGRFTKIIFAGIGFFAGFISGFTGAVGLLFNKYYLKMNFTKEQVIATRAANEVFLHLIKLVLYVGMGIYSRNSFLLGLAIAAASFVSAGSMKFILRFISEHSFRKIGYAAMALSGAVLFFTTAGQIADKNNIQLVTITNNNKTELILHVKENRYTAEFSAGRLELERSINFKDLPPKYRAYYTKYCDDFEKVLIEEVYKGRTLVEYEFNAYRKGKLFKFKYNCV